MDAPLLCDVLSSSPKEDVTHLANAHHQIRIIIRLLVTLIIAGAYDCCGPAAIIRPRYYERNQKTNYDPDLMVRIGEVRDVFLGR